LIVVFFEEGRAEVKSSWSECVGLHTFYNGGNKKLRKFNLE